MHPSNGELLKHVTSASQQRLRTAPHEEDRQRILPCTAVCRLVRDRLSINGANKLGGRAHEDVRAQKTNDVALATTRFMSRA